MESKRGCVKEARILLSRVLFVFTNYPVEVSLLALAYFFPQYKYFRIAAIHYGRDISKSPTKRIQK